LHEEGRGLGDAGSSGTPGYLPPEASGLDPPTPAADVYALGVVLYEIATGRGPAAVNTRPGVGLRYDESDLALRERLRQEEPPRTVRPQIPEVPRPLWRTVGACLRADPVARPMAARLAEDLAALGKDDGARSVQPADGVPPATSGTEPGWPDTPVEPDELPTPVRDRRGPEVPETVAPKVRSRWMVGLPPVVACVSATVLVTVVGAVLQRTWSSSATSPETTTVTMPAERASARTSAERYFAPTGWICTVSTAQTTTGDGSNGGGRRNDALRLCLGIWDGMVHASVRHAGVALTAAPEVSTVPSAGASLLGRSGLSPPPRSVWSVKLELRSIASEPGATAMTRVFRCDLSPHTGRNRCDVEPVAARAGLTYSVAAYVLRSASRTPVAASFPKTPTVLTPLIQNGRSQDHGTPLKGAYGVLTIDPP
jgi:hypothetical protein